MPQRFEKHVTCHVPSCCAIDLLAAEVPLSRQRLKTAMTNGSVWLESGHGINRIRRAKKILHCGDTLHLYYDSEIQAHTPAAASLVADEGDYSVWNKPCGMLSQGSKWGDHCTIYRWAEQHTEPPRPAYLVHRLDRAANGLIIIAHNRKTATAFMHMFRKGAVNKQYRAAVEGKFGEAALPRTLSSPVDGRTAKTVVMDARYDEDSNTTRLLVRIHTGRKHQIRKHLSEAGHPIAGDRLYGAADQDTDLQLSAVRLGFESPVNGRWCDYALPTWYERDEPAAPEKSHQ